MSDPLQLVQAVPGAEPSVSQPTRPSFQGLLRRASDSALSLSRRVPLIRPLVRCLHPTAAIIHRSGLFDGKWYLQKYPDITEAKADPLSHYVARGFSEGRFPNPLFDSLWYLATNADVRAAGGNPLAHYIRSGEAEGRRPNRFFDPHWYRRHNSDIGELSPLRHFLQYGSWELRLPSAAFDPAAYLSANAGLDGLVGGPLAHYLHCGRPEARESGPYHISAIPAGGIGYAAANGQSRGRYTLSRQPSPYAYMPPRKPLNYEPWRASLQHAPFFSIVTPVYNVSPAFLEALVRSVRGQWYDLWELILVDDASSRSETRNFLLDLQDSALADARISVLIRKTNGGIANATNTALGACRGDFVVFLDHDDELTEDCLYELAKVASDSEVDYIYSDEDKIDEHGVFSSPFYKPDWSPDTFMSTMYTCHVSCVRRSLINEVEGLRPQFDGAQDYDLILRLTEKTSKIAHIPRVLYHWRTLKTSIAYDLGAKPTATDAAAAAKSAALQRRGLLAEVEPVVSMPGQHHIRYQVRDRPTVSVIIPSRDNIDFLSPCLESLFSSESHADVEIIIVDNGSIDPVTMKFLNELLHRPGVKIMEDARPFNFSAINNLGAGAASGAYILFLNDDIVAPPTDWIARMVGYASLEHVGAVGAKLLYPDGSIQHAGILNLNDGPGHAFLRRVPSLPLHFGRNILEYNWLAVTGACMMVAREKFEVVGKFDEAFPIAYNDVELCFRFFKSGYYNVVLNAVELIHHESVSRGYDVDPVRATRLQKDWRRLYEKHPDLYMHDPFHNRNLNPKDVCFGE